MKYLFILLSFIVVFVGCSKQSPNEEVPAYDGITVAVNRSSKYTVSEFQIGNSIVSQVLKPWGGNPMALDRMWNHMQAGKINLQNFHIMGFGAGNPWPDKNEPINFSDLEQSINAAKSGMNNTEIVITLCTAPGWMKPSGNDWNMNDKVSKDHYQDFATLSKEIALHFPDIKYFQVWNELKGWWMGDIEGFTEFYNIVYDAVKSVRPDAIIGGPYMGIGLENGGQFSQKTNEAFDYFLANMSGADFISFDGWLTGYPVSATKLTTEKALMDNTACFGEAVAQLRTKTNLPVWIPEIYSAQTENSENFDFLTANNASIYYHCLINKVSVALHWEAFGFVAFFTNPDSEDGAQPTKHFEVVSIFNNYFGPGEQLFSTTCDDNEKLEVLASATKTLLINKTNTSIKVKLCDKEISLNAYQVKLLDDSSSCNN